MKQLILGTNRKMIPHDAFYLGTSTNIVLKVKIRPELGFCKDTELGFFFFVIEAKHIGRKEN